MYIGIDLNMAQKIILKSLAIEINQNFSGPSAIANVMWKKKKKSRKKTIVECENVYRNCIKYQTTTVWPDELSILTNKQTTEKKHLIFTEKKKRF